VETSQSTTKPLITPGRFNPRKLCPSINAICSSPDHKQVYFSTETDSVTTHFLAKTGAQDGKPIALRIGDQMQIDP
jgi:hypothetical protein